MSKSGDEKKALRDGVSRPDALEDLYADHPLTEDTTCGIWFFRGAWMQRFANKKAYVFLYGILGCIFSSSYAYFNGTITTLEKRFKIPSRTTGIITVGNDISQLMVSMLISYYAGRGHRPRWIALGLYTVVLYCLLTGFLHVLYGPGNDALTLTEEYGALNTTLNAIYLDKRKQLCNGDGDSAKCEVEDGGYAPQVMLFMANFIAGIGGSLYYTLGVSYMDDNTQKSKTPVLISFSYFLRMLGPAIGYALASLCLKYYISPTLTPTITKEDPRWLGAWWLGWIILAVALFLFSSLMALFPKTLPRAAVRKMIEMEKLKKEDKMAEPELKPSMQDMMVTFKRLLVNPTLMCNNLASVFYFMGYMPYWIFMPKYIETQYRQSASLSSLITGTVGLVFSAIGILLSGLVITKFRPKARHLAVWNVFVGALSVAGMISYAFLGCPANHNYGSILASGELATSLTCNKDCSCDHVKYSPVCAEDGVTSFISACHAGCSQDMLINNTKVLTNCSCIPHSNPLDIMGYGAGNASDDWRAGGGFATPGSCPVDCSTQFYMFLAVVCLLKFSGATGRASNFLVSVRCVEEKDKPVALGFGLTAMSLFAFIPSPILFGYLLDKTCLVWGKTCSGTGNCWLYDGETLRYLMNFTAAAFVTVGTLFDVGVWFYVKHLKIFDDEVDAEQTEQKRDVIIPYPAPEVPGSIPTPLAASED